MAGEKRGNMTVKKMTRLLAMALALLLALPCAAWCEAAQESAAEDDPVLLTLDGETYRRSVIDTYIQNLMYYGYLESANEYELAIQYIVENKVINDKIAEWGLDQYTEEEKEAFRTEVLSELEPQHDSIISNYVSYFLTENSDEARAELTQAAEEYYQQLIENYLEDAISQDGYDRLLTRLFAENGTTFTDSAILEVFNQEAEEQKAVYEGNVYMYELYKAYGYDPWYRPTGYRGVLQILFEVDSDLLEAYQTAQNAYEDSLNADESVDSAALKATADAARQAVLDSQKDKIDAVYTRLTNGEAFETLVKEYDQAESGDDDFLKTGYEIHPDSVAVGWDNVFVDAVFSDKMTQPGAVSDPVVSSYGVQILYYLRDVPGGPVEMTDEIKAEIREYLEGTMKNDLLGQAMENWKAGHEIILNTEAIEEAKKSAGQPAQTEGDQDSLDSLSDEELEQLFSMLNDGATEEETQPETAQ